MPKYLSEKKKFNRDSQTRIVRNAKETDLITANAAFSQNSLRYNGSQMYESLSNEMKTENMEAIFERKLTEYV